MLFDYKGISDNESDDNTEENNQHTDDLFELNGDVDPSLLALELESMTTIVVKTFLRNECLARLLHSIRKKYQKIRIIVATDSPVQYKTVSVKNHDTLFICLLHFSKFLKPVLPCGRVV